MHPVTEKEPSVESTPKSESSKKRKAPEPTNKKAAMGSKIDVAEQYHMTKNEHYRNSKVHGLQDGPLRGGMFVMNNLKQAVTLSFCFQKDGKWYGVTVGHIAQTEEPIWAFVRRGSREARRIGTVVSKSQKTDSLVFLIDTTVPDLRVEGEMILAENSGLGNEPFTLCSSESPGLEVGPSLLGFGARGTIGDVKTISVSSQMARGKKYLEGDVGISSPDGKARVTHPGDCGTIVVDKSGHGRLMYHVIETTETIMNKRSTGELWQSFGVRLEKVFAAHALLGGEDERKDDVSVYQSHESSPGAKPNNVIESKQSYDILYFPDVVFEGEAHTSYDVGPSSLEVVFVD